MKFQIRQMFTKTTDTQNRQINIQRIQRHCFWTRGTIIDLRTFVNRDRMFIRTNNVTNGPP